MVATMVRVGMRLPSPSSTAVEVADFGADAGLDVDAM